MWWTPKAILLHCILAVCVPGFVALFLWQVDRVREGNGLSWAYVFEWPFFTGYAIYLWWKLVHEQDDPVVAPSAGTGLAAGEPPSDGHPVEAAAPSGADAHAAPQTPAATDDEDDEVAAYNRYLAELNASGRRKRW